MKTNQLKNLSLAMFAILALLTTATLAQGPGRGPGAGPGPGFNDDFPGCRIPGLTEEQKSAMEKLRTAHLKKAELTRAEIGEKEARLNTLRLADEPDVKAIDRTIDDISKLRGDLMKEREAQQREIRNLLTDDQKAMYDARPGRGYRRHAYGARNDRDDRPGRGNGRGNGRGFGPGNGQCGNCPYSK